MSVIINLFEYRNKLEHFADKHYSIGDKTVFDLVAECDKEISEQVPLNAEEALVQLKILKNYLADTLPEEEGCFVTSISNSLIKNISIYLDS